MLATLTNRNPKFLTLAWPTVGSLIFLHRYVKRTVSLCFAALRQLCQIRRAAPTATSQMLVVAHGIYTHALEVLYVIALYKSTFTYLLTYSRLDYGNAVLVGIPAYLVHRLQSVLNAAARLIYHLRPYDHISDALATLHWLHVPERVQYKIAVLTFKMLHDNAPRYLGPLVAIADLPGRRALRSASTSRLVAPPIKLSTVSAVLFRLPQLKPGTVCQRPSSHRHHCRTHLFNFHTLT